MYKFFKILLSPLSFVEIILIWFYKKIISPNIKSSCCFIPTCSVYTYRCIFKFDALTGVILGIKRLCKCNGKHLGGVDLEPLNILGEYKWVC